MSVRSQRPVWVLPLVLSLCAFAGTAARAEGLYLGAQVGKPTYPASLNRINGSAGGTATGLFAGYQLDPSWSLEGGLTSLGKLSNGVDAAQARVTYLEAINTVALAPQWSLIGGLGLAHGRFTSTLGNDQSTAFTWRAGLQYDLSSTVALRGQYDQYHFTNAYESKPNLGAFSLGVKVGF